MKSILTFVFSVSAVIAFSQSADFDQRLLAKYSKAQIESLQSTNPEVIAYWTYYLDHGYYIADMPSGKEGDVLREVAIGNPSKFNILKAGVPTPGDAPRTYAIKGSSQVLVVRSNDDFVREFNSHHAKK